MSQVFPPAFLDVMRQRLGPDLDQWTTAMADSPPVSIRLNPRKPFTSPESTSVPWTKEGRYLPERPVFALDPLWHAGAYYVQEASSMLLEAAVPKYLREKPILALDLCGAPGGKSTHLQSLIHPESLLVSNEVIRQRTHILHENLSKWGGGNHIITQADPARLGAVSDFFDLIVVDAPCSGEGMFRKDPNASSEWSPDHVKLCASRQRRILDDIWPALRSGGILIYSTCTWNPHEDESQVNRLIDEEGATVLPLTEFHSDWGFLPIPLRHGQGYMALPHRVQGEGFFLAVLQKPEADSTMTLDKSGKLIRATRKEREAAAAFTPEGWTLFQHKGNLFALPEATTAAADHVLQRVAPYSVGVGVGEVKGKDFRPSAEAALWTQLSKDAAPRINLGKTDALQFLRRDNLAFTKEKGWVLVSYEDIPLGWAKGIGHRVNNYYPQEWRLRMEL